MNFFSGIKIPLDTGDFRLIDRTVIDALKNFPEKGRFMRGLIAWIGFNQISVRYVRDPRFAGATKYSLKKMLSFAIEGLTNGSWVLIDGGDIIVHLFDVETRSMYDLDNLWASQISPKDSIV